MQTDSAEVETGVFKALTFTCILIFLMPWIMQVCLVSDPALEHEIIFICFFESQGYDKNVMVH